MGVSKVIGGFLTARERGLVLLTPHSLSVNCTSLVQLDICSVPYVPLCAKYFSRYWEIAVNFSPKVPILLELMFKWNYIN